MFLSHSRSLSNSKKILVSYCGHWQIGMALCATIIEWGTYILIARALAPSFFGAYVFVQWLAAFMVPLIGVGTSTLSSRRIADLQSRETSRSAAGIFYFLWYRQCQSMLLYCMLYISLVYPLFWLFHVCEPQLLLLAGLTVLPLFLSSVAGITLRSLRRIDLLTILHLFGALCTLLLCLLASQANKERIGMFLLASSLAGTLTLIMAIFCVTRLLPLRQALRPGIFLKERLLEQLKKAPLLFICDLIVWQRSELLLLACWRRSNELAFYTMSVLFSTGILELAPLLFSLLMQPLLQRYFPQRRYLDAYGTFVRSSCYIALLALSLCISAILVSPMLIRTLFGAGYLPLILPLRILLVSALFGSVATVSLTHLTANEHKRALLRVGVVAATLNVLLAVPFVMLWGVIGAALACTCAQIVSSIGSILLCSRHLKRSVTMQLKDRRQAR
jgi:O-antigen/teichoic acid export membrane protein